MRRPAPGRARAADLPATPRVVVAGDQPVARGLRLLLAEQVGDAIAGDAKQPGAYLLNGLDQARRLHQFVENFLEDVVGVARVGHPLANEATQAGALFLERRGDRTVLFGHACIPPQFRFHVREDVGAREILWAGRNGLRVKPAMTAESTGMQPRRNCATCASATAGSPRRAGSRWRACRCAGAGRRVRDRNDWPCRAA